MSLVESVASHSLTTLGRDISTLRGTLIRMALSSSTPASKAVLNSLLALSSMHQNGLGLQAIEHKVLALRQLTESFNKGVGTQESIQHTAAGMILCSFEV